MGNKTKITTEGGPTLWDGLDTQETPETGQGAAPQEPTPTGNATAEEWADLMRTVEETKRAAEGAGLWLLLSSETLLRRGEIYYNQRVEKIADTMRGSGATDDTIDAVCSDYLGVLSGFNMFTATPVQMRDALKALRPVEAFNIDRYGLYFGVLTNYSRFLFRFQDYTEAVKSEAATTESKHEFLQGFYSAMDARAIRWLLNVGYFSPSDFAGFDLSEMGEFFGRIAQFAEMGEYVLYYVVARLALLATPAELDDVPPPPHLLNSQTPITVFCEWSVQETVKMLDRAADKFEAAVTSDTPTEQEQARQAGKDWHDDANTQPVKIHENYGIVLSRPVNVSPNGREISKTLPIQPYIDQFNAHPVAFGNVTQFGTVTEQSVQRVFEGLNLLPQYLRGKMETDGGGRLSFRTNLSEFAEICGYADAGQAEKTALLGGLLVLRNLFFVVQRPYRYREYIDRKGRKRRQQDGGQVAIQFVNVREIGLDTGELYIEIYPESLRGRPTLITPTTYKRLRAKAKSTRQSRFNAQIATKSHKSENDLIDEVFGLADMLKYADTDTERQRVKTYIQNHRAEFRKKVLAWFDEYVRDGVLTEYKREPSKTNKRDFVLSWVCPDTSKLDPPPFDPQEPADEQ